MSPGGIQTSSKELKQSRNPRTGGIGLFLRVYLRGMANLYMPGTRKES